MSKDFSDSIVSIEKTRFFALILVGVLVGLTFSHFGVGIEPKNVDAYPSSTYTPFHPQEYRAALQAGYILRNALTEDPMMEDRVSKYYRVGAPTMRTDDEGNIVAVSVTLFYNIPGLPQNPRVVEVLGHYWRLPAGFDPEPWNYSQEAFKMYALDRMKAEVRYMEEQRMAPSLNI